MENGTDQVFFFSNEVKYSLIFSRLYNYLIMFPYNQVLSDISKNIITIYTDFYSWLVEKIVDVFKIGVL